MSSTASFEILRRVKMQAGAGVAPLWHWIADASSPDAVVAWIEQTGPTHCPGRC